MRRFSEEISKYRSKTKGDPRGWAPGLALVLKLIETEYGKHEKPLGVQQRGYFRQEIAALNGMILGEQRISKGLAETFMEKASKVAKKVDELP